MSQFGSFYQPEIRRNYSCEEMNDHIQKKCRQCKPPTLLKTTGNSRQSTVWWLESKLRPRVAICVGPTPRLGEIFNLWSESRALGSRSNEHLQQGKQGQKHHSYWNPNLKILKFKISNSNPGRAIAQTPPTEQYFVRKMLRGKLERQCIILAHLAPRQTTFTGFTFETREDQEHRCLENVPQNVVWGRPRLRRLSKLITEVSHLIHTTT